MALNDAAKNLMLDALTDPTTGVDYISLHTADPGATGTNEVTGGSPAYARLNITWAAASGGSVSENTGTDPVFDVPAGTITHLGLWDAVTSGNFYGSADITDETYGGQGTYTVTALTVTITG
jgi:hypothetical protein